MLDCLMIKKNLMTGEFENFEDSGFSLFSIENTSNKYLKEGKEKSKSKGYMFSKYCFWFLSVVSIIAAVYLSYNCNADKSFYEWVLIPIFAFFFPLIYLIYYFIYRYLLENPCN